MDREWDILHTALRPLSCGGGLNGLTADRRECWRREGVSYCRISGLWKAQAESGDVASDGASNKCGVVAAMVEMAVTSGQVMSVVVHKAEGQAESDDVVSDGASNVFE